MPNVMAALPNIGLGGDFTLFSALSMQHSVLCELYSLDLYSFHLTLFLDDVVSDVTKWSVIHTENVT